MSANVATPYLAMPLPRCAFVLDRHTHKNGGSTMRSIFADNDRLDGWVYWGYSLNQQAPFAQRLVAALQPPRGNGSCFASGRSSLRVIAEHESGVADTLEFMRRWEERYLDHLEASRALLELLSSVTSRANADVNAELPQVPTLSQTLGGPGGGHGGSHGGVRGGGERFASSGSFGRAAAGRGGGASSDPRSDPRCV